LSGAIEPLAPAERRETGEPDSIFFVGDSITLGWRDEDIGGWPVRLMARLDPDRSITAYNLGVRGDTSEQILARWQEEVLRRRRSMSRSVIVFAFGANDAKVTAGDEPIIALDVFRRNTRRILATAASEHRVLFIGPAPVDESALARVINPTGSVPVPSNRRIAEISGVLAQETAAVAIPYLDLMRSLSGEESWYSGLRGTDGIHPPARGHDQIAAHVAGWQPWQSLFGRGER
jgi:lysophospholipase L1-like esterase